MDRWRSKSMENSNTHYDTLFINLLILFRCFYSAVNTEPNSGTLDTRWDNTQEVIPVYHTLRI